MNHQLVVYRYMGVDHPQNGVRVIFPVKQLINCIKQVNATRYLAVSCGNAMEIYDVISKSKVRTIDTGMPFQLLLKASPLNFKAEFGMIAESFVGYSYKNFFECSIVIDKGPQILDHHMASIQELEMKRKRKIFKINMKPEALIAAC